MHFIRCQKRNAVLEPFHGGISGIWQQLFNNDQLVCLLLMMPPTNHFSSIEPLEVIGTFRIVCATGNMLQLYNAASDMMVSDDQGDRPSGIIKHKAIFAQFIVAANTACEELCEGVKTITTPYKDYWWVHRTIALDIKHPRGQQHAAQSAKG